MTVVAADQTAVVAGNGASLADITPGTVSTDDFILRTNSFFFEPAYYLGRRVDLAMIAGDPRVMPFVFETLWACRSHYDLKGWSTHDLRGLKAGQRRFAPLYRPMRYRDPEMETEVGALCARYQRKPTTGVITALMAHALGARQIVLAGIDLYTTDRRYVYDPGLNYRALMGLDVGGRGIDDKLHSQDLDRAVLAALNARRDVTLFAASANTALTDIMEPAPQRPGPRPDCAPHDAPKDWVGRVGLYPIGLLRLLRSGRSLQKRMVAPKAL